MIKRPIAAQFPDARPILRLIVWILSIVCALGCGVAVPARSDDRPNVVIVYADDLGYGDVGCFNPNSKIPTPHLDRLAAEVIRLTNAHSSSGICSPSRYALLTGRYHWRKFHGIVNSFGPSVFDPDELTMAEMFRASGYRTASIGKWHLGWDWQALRRDGAAPPYSAKQLAPGDDWDWSRKIPDGPCDHGFDVYFGDDVPNFPPYAWIENDRIVTAPAESYEPNPKPDEGAPEGRPGPMVAGWRQDLVMPELVKKSVAFIRESAASDQPFFLYVPLTAPHAPIVPAESFRGRSSAGPYGDFVVETDWALGEITAALKAAGVTDQTLVIFTSDNGPEGYAYERWRRFEHRSAGPLRGAKRDLWEGGHREPTIVRWPGRVAAGTVTDALFGQIDLFATLAAVLDFELPAGSAPDSLNQLALLTDSGPGARRTLVHNTNKDRYAIRMDDWLLIAANTGTVTRVPDWYADESKYVEFPGPALLFDLSMDLGQRVDLSEQYPERVAAMTAELDRIRSQADDR